MLPVMFAVLIGLVVYAVLLRFVLVEQLEYNDESGSQDMGTTPLRSAEVGDPVYLRHVEECEWKPGMCMYDVCEDHTPEAGVRGRGYQVHLNDVASIENEHFVGQVVYMARPTHSKKIEREGYKYKCHFDKNADLGAARPGTF